MTTKPTKQTHPLTKDDLLLRIAKALEELVAVEKDKQELEMIRGRNFGNWPPG